MTLGVQSTLLFSQVLNYYIKQKFAENDMNIRFIERGRYFLNFEMPNLKTFHSFLKPKLEIV